METPQETPMERPPALTASQIRRRLDFLTVLAYGLMESGQTSSQVEPVVRRTAVALGVDNLGFNAFGRILLIDTTRGDGSTSSVSGAARGLDMIDCTRARALQDVAMGLVQAATSADTAELAVEARLDTAKDRVDRLRESATPWWLSMGGLTMLAFFISMQVGVSWQAWVSAALVQLASSLMGAATGAVRMPKLFATAVQGCTSGALATVLVLVGFVDPVGAAAAIAVSWLILVPLPQVIGAVSDAIASDFVSAMTRTASLLVAVISLTIAGAFTFMLGEVLHMEHPRLDELPSFPWYLVLVFCALGAVANAFANGGRLPLVLPAAGLGLVTGAVNQALLIGVGLPTLWANSLAAVVLGALAAFYAVRSGYPQQVLALMGFTGALMPGIPVFFGILQLMGGGQGMSSFAEAAAICVGIGTGVGLGAYPVDVVRRHRRGTDAWLHRFGARA
jgi:uncharacterized membrane protein YjjP (DUF1212 family)